MKCEKCGKNEATTYYKESVNGAVREMRLCTDCAQALHVGGGLQSAFAGIMQGGFFPFGASVFGTGLGALLTGAGTQTQRSCPTCGRTESELRRTGRAGCPDCYHAFEDILNPYIRSLQGTDSHVGACPQAETPPAQNPADGLRAKLQEAVAAENYEEAARLRDEIRRLEGEGA